MYYMVLDGSNSEYGEAEKPVTESIFVGESIPGDLAFTIDSTNAAALQAAGEWEKEDSSDVLEEVEAGAPSSGDSSLQFSKQRALHGLRKYREFVSDVVAKFCEQRHVIEAGHPQSLHDDIVAYIVRVVGRGPVKDYAATGELIMNSGEIEIVLKSLLSSEAFIDMCIRRGKDMERSINESAPSVNGDKSAA